MKAAGTTGRAIGAMKYAACLAAVLPMLTPSVAFAQMRQQSQNDQTCSTQMDRWVDLKFDSLRQGLNSGTEVKTVPIAGRRTLSFRQPIGRVEVDREGVILVSAPSPSSLRVTGLAQGDAVVSVYGDDGALIEESRIAVVAAGASTRNAAWFPPAGDKVVAIDVQFAAVSDSTLKALGFNFSKLSGDLQGAVVSPSSLTGFEFRPNSRTTEIESGPGGTTVKSELTRGGLGLETTSPIQGAFNLFLSARNHGIGAVLSALSSNGLSEVLAQPTLLVRSGEKATFLAGGEIPIPVPQNSGAGGNTITIDYKKFGVQLSVMPRVVSPDQITLMIAPEVSELDYGIGVQLQGFTVPGLRRRCAETTVELGTGQSFVIAGLNFSNSSVTREKVPFLGDIPVLGAFFKRQQNQKERQQLIIVATPRLVDPLKPEDVPPLPRAGVDPSIGDMILGTDGLDQAQAPFGVVRR